MHDHTKKVNENCYAGYPYRRGAQAWRHILTSLIIVDHGTWQPWPPHQEVLPHPGSMNPININCRGGLSPWTVLTLKVPAKNCENQWTHGCPHKRNLLSTFGSWEKQKMLNFTLLSKKKEAKSEVIQKKSSFIIRTVSVAVLLLWTYSPCLYWAEFSSFVIGKT